MDLAAVRGVEPLRVKVKVSCLTVWRHRNMYFCIYKYVIRIIKINGYAATHIHLLDWRRRRDSNSRIGVDR